MLHEFITANRSEIIARCRAKIASRSAPRPTDVELEHGVPLFLDQLANTLRLALMTHPAIGQSAARHGNELLHRGFTVAQLHDVLERVAARPVAVALRRGSYAALRASVIEKGPAGFTAVGHAKHVNKQWRNYFSHAQLLESLKTRIS